MKFPVLRASNLHRNKLTLPYDLKGDLNIVLVPFYQWHQSVVDTWIPFVRQIEKDFAGVYYYELPTIRKMNPIAQTFINEGMRAGIPDSISRERTITLYLDKRSFRNALNLQAEDDIYSLLIDRQGNVYWRAEGAYSLEKGMALQQVLNGLIKSEKHLEPAKYLRGNQERLHNQKVQGV